MNEATFVDRREPDWKQLTALCDRGEVTLKTLSREDLKEFVRLYRNVSGDLAAVRTSSTNAALVQFLNDLVARAYGILYRAPRNTFGKALSQAMLTAVQTVRRRKAFIFASAALFFGTALLSAPLAEARPDIGDRVLPKFLSDQWTKGQFPDRGAGQSMMMWSFYASNNPRVALITGAVAAGTFGLGTVTILSENGMLLGVLAARMADVGKLGYLFASILPHGVPELSGIIVSGAAGLALGWALVCPGRRRRGLALRDAGADAIVLLSTSAVLMLIAAPIEGFFSFNQGIPSSVKAAVAVLEIVLWTAFWVGYGNRVQPVS